MSGVGLILLAAGGSSRMGRPKQLLAYQGRTLLRRAAETAVASACAPIIVVVGARDEHISRELQGLPGVNIEPNPDWNRGMGTSIRAGLRRVLRESPEVSGIVIMLCDQPHVGAIHIRQLVELHRETARSVIASEYAGTLGPPAFFSRARFADLQRIDDASGAKGIITAAESDRAVLSIPDAGIDIDTPEDFRRLTEG